MILNTLDNVILCRACRHFMEKKSNRKILLSESGIVSRVQMNPRARAKTKTSPKRKVFSIVLVILIAFFVFQLVVNFLDIKMDVINPSAEQTTIEYTNSIYYDYPSSPDVPHITIDENGTSHGLPLFSLTITYSYNDILAEGTTFYLTASGSLYPEGQQTIDRVDVGYDGASFADGSFRNYPPLFTANLYDADYLSMVAPPSGEVLVLPIRWNTQGDYYPYIVITYKNGSVPTTVNLIDGKVHVFGLDIVLQEEYNRKQEINNRRYMVIAFDVGVISILIVLIGYVLRVKPNKKAQTSGKKHHPKGGKKYHRKRRKKPKPKSSGKRKRNLQEMKSAE